LEKFEQEEVQSFEFLMEACGTYVIQAYCQSQPFNKEYIMNEQWLTKLTSMWVVSQKDNEYNPIHVHEECHLSAVMYLKIPEYLPNRKTGNRALDDGALTFTSNVSKDPIWGIPNMTISPKVGQFFIFPASQQHCVYPFKTSDGKGERRCISFNTIFANKTELDRIEKEKGIKI
jgi:hypothetical protein